MSIHRRKYSKEFKMEMVEAALSGQSPLVIGKNNNLNPNLISRWKRQYLSGRFHGNSKNDTELRKLKIKVCELEQMVGKLTMENYILKKEKEFIAQAKKESSSIVTGANLDQLRRHAGQWNYQGPHITTSLREILPNKCMTLILLTPLRKLYIIFHLMATGGLRQP